MMHELIRDKLILDQKLGQETTQVLLEGDIIVPDVKPDMAVILQTDARINIDKFEVGTDRVSFAGSLEVSVLYLGRGTQNRLVHSIRQSLPVDDFVNIEGANRDMWVEVEAELTNIDYRMLNDRKINYRAVVDISVSCEHTEEHEVVVNIGDIPPNQLLKTSLSVNRRIENKRDSISINESLAIPVGKPNIGTLLQTSVSVGNKDVRLGSGRITINGELLVTNLYTGLDEASLIEIVENEIPFSGTIEVEGAREDMIADVYFRVNNTNCTIRPDADGEERVFELDITLDVVAKVHSMENLDILEDAYSTNHDLDISKTPIKYPRLVCRNRNQFPFKEVVQLPTEAPPILQILKVQGRPIIDDCKVIDDKVVLEGIIEADILYVAESDELPLCSHKATLPFRQLIETKGSAVGMSVVRDVSNDHVGFNMLSQSEVELRFLLSFGIQVIDEKSCNMITDISFNDIDAAALNSMASIVLYVVQKGDTLWKIAKRYNASLDSLLSINDLEPNRDLHVGQKLLLLR